MTDIYDFTYSVLSVFTSMVAFFVVLNCTLGLYDMWEARAGKGSE